MALSQVAVQSVDAVLSNRGVVVSSPATRSAGAGASRSTTPTSKAVTATLGQGRHPDFQRPGACPLGLSPLGTSFAGSSPGGVSRRTAQD